MENKDYGLVYVLSNPWMKGLVKIGFTTKHDLAERMDELYKTGVPVPFVAESSCKVPVDQLRVVEKALHTAFNSHRVGSHEFFELSPDAVKPLIETFNAAYGLGDASDEVQHEIEKVTEADEIAHGKKPNMDFFKMKLKKGDTLVFARDNSVTCTIASSRKVLYNGKEVSLSSITKDLLGYASQPSPYWQAADGTPLTKLYASYVQRLANERTMKQTRVAELAADAITI